MAHAVPCPWRVDLNAVRKGALASCGRQVNTDFEMAGKADAAHKQFKIHNSYRD